MTIKIKCEHYKKYKNKDDIVKETGFCFECDPVLYLITLWRNQEIFLEELKLSNPEYNVIEERKLNLWEKIFGYSVKLKAPII